MNTTLQGTPNQLHRSPQQVEKHRRSLSAADELSSIIVLKTVPRRFYSKLPLPPGPPWPRGNSPQSVSEGGGRYHCYLKKTNLFVWRFRLIRVQVGSQCTHQNERSQGSCNNHSDRKFRSLIQGCLRSTKKSVFRLPVCDPSCRRRFWGTYHFPQPPSC